MCHNKEKNTCSCGEIHIYDSIFVLKEKSYTFVCHKKGINFMKTVYLGKEAEIVEKKSRFIATVCPISSEEEAIAFINEMKKKYWNAKHNCSAFTLGEHHEITRCSDDGEPAQTAGRPMLDVLLKEEIHNVCVVVTRYFGGVLLGTGGLVRAYQKAVQKGLDASVVIDKKEGRRLTIGTDYNGLGKLQYILAKEKVTVFDTIYTDKVELVVIVPNEIQQKLEKEIIDATSKTAQILWGEEVFYAMIENNLKIFEKNA